MLSVAIEVLTCGKVSAEVALALCCGVAALCAQDLVALLATPAGTVGTSLAC